MQNASGVLNLIFALLQFKGTKCDFKLMESANVNPHQSRKIEIHSNHTSLQLQLQYAFCSVHSDIVLTFPSEH